MLTKKTFERVRTAVIVHVFYRELWPDLKRCIENIRGCGFAGDVDVFVTYPQVQSPIMDVSGAQIVPVENRGWDGWPFCKILNMLDLASYDYIVKLHTKRDIPTFWLNFHVFHGGEWRESLLSFCATPDATRRTFRALAHYPRIGMVAGERVIDPVGGGTWRKQELRKQDDIVREYGYEPKERTLVYGTMFVVRAELLMPIWRRYSAGDFVIPLSGNEHAGYGLAGDLELVYGLLVRAQGYSVSSAIMPEWLMRVWYCCKGFAFRVIRIASDYIRKSPFSGSYSSLLDRIAK